MKNSMKGLRSMKNIFGLVLVASILMLPSCEIPTDLNDNPNEITLQDPAPSLFLNGAQLANIMIRIVILIGLPECFPDN